MAKKYLGIDVLTAARQRISKVFDDFPRIYVSFSGGKDSSVMLHLVAPRRGAWIEIFTGILTSSEFVGRSPQGSVD